MYPRVKVIDNSLRREAEVNFYMKNQAIGIDKRACVGCGICTKICPKGAIKTPSLEGKIRLKTEEIIPEIPNALDCSFCGTCVYMCPFNAIFLKKNDKLIVPKHLEIVSKKVVPRLLFDFVHCEKIDREARVYFEGKITVDWDKCASCMNCAGLCPTGAFTEIEKHLRTPSGPKVEFDPSKCISCGTCEIGCTGKAISLNLEKVNYSGEKKEIFWNEILKKLKNEQ